MSVPNDLVQQIDARFVALQELFKTQLATFQEAAARQAEAAARQAETVARQTEEIAFLREELALIKSRSTSPKVTLTPPPEQNGQQLPEQTLMSGTGSSKSNHECSAVPERPVLSERLPDPAIYTGKRNLLPEFLTQLENKLQGNADRYTTPESRLRYAVSRLGGDAASLIRSLRPDTLEGLIQNLEASYGDPNRQVTAQNKLSRLTQGTRSFPSFFAEFHRYARESGWNEPALINHLRQTVNQELRSALVGRQLPDSLEDCANVIASIYNDLQLLAPKKKHSPTHHDSRPAPTRNPDAMDLDSVRHSYAPKGSEERRRRVEKGLCFKCGSKTHISPGCKVPIPTSRTDLRNSSGQGKSGSNSRRRGRHSSEHSSRRSSRSPSRPSSDSSRSTRSSRSPKGPSRR
jgi:hypothetical protein